MAAATNAIPIHKSGRRCGGGANCPLSAFPPAFTSMGPWNALNTINRRPPRRRTFQKEFGSSGSIEVVGKLSGSREGGYEPVRPREMAGLHFKGERQKIAGQPRRQQAEKAAERPGAAVSCYWLLVEGSGLVPKSHLENACIFEAELREPIIRSQAGAWERGRNQPPRPGRSPPPPGCMPYGQEAKNWSLVTRLRSRSYGVAKARHWSLSYQFLRCE